MPLDTRSHLAAAAAAICALGLSACAPGMEETDPPADVETEEYGVSMSTTTIGGHPAWAHFTNPLAHADGYDHTILDEAIRLIDDTPSGATIRAAIHSLTVNGVANALINAKTRGVMIQVVEDGSDEFEEDATPGKLAAALGAKHVYCGDGQKGGNYGCITSDPSGIMHTKLFTFSQTKDPSGALQSNVVWFGSANMTHATGGKTFNNTITIYGDTELFNEFNAYFSHLFNQKHYASNNYYEASSERGYWATPSARVYASPEKQGEGDLVKNRLNDINPDSSCRVRVAQAMIHDSRGAIVDHLVSLKKGGCKVWVVGSSIEAESLGKLKKAGIPVRKNKVHDKTIIVDAKFAGSNQNRKLVFTGSHNWTYSANYRNDEIFVRLESADFYSSFQGHFNDAYNTGAPQ